jgi:hypothetical protein
MNLLRYAIRRRHSTAAFLAVATVVVLGNVFAVRMHPSMGLGGPPEWPVAIDLLVLLPALYLYLHRPLTRATLIRAAMIASLGVVVGSLLLPASSKSLWTWLESGRYVAIGAVVALQLVIVALVIRDALAVKGEPLELALHASIARRVEGPLRPLLCLEARLWAYALAPKRALAGWPDAAAFLGARHGGNASNQQGFLIIIGAEIPIVHALLHFMWSPVAAVVVSVASIYGFLFLLAEFRATLHRPIVAGSRSLHVRSGLVHDFEVPWDAIAAVAKCAPTTPRRSRGRIRCFGMGAANVVLGLREGTRVAMPFGPAEAREIFLGIDAPAEFVALVEARIRGR